MCIEDSIFSDGCAAKLFAKVDWYCTFITTNHQGRLISRIAHLVVALFAFPILSLQDFSHCQLQALHL